MIYTSNDSSMNVFRRRYLPALVSGALAFGASMHVLAASAPDALAPSAAGAAMPTTTGPAAASAMSTPQPVGNQAFPAAPEAPAGSRNVRVSLKQLGANYPLNLRGVDGSNSVPFNVRTDEIVTAARLTLSYAYSPALLPDLSHINVMINGEVASTIAVPKETAGVALQHSIDLPPRLITEFNRINLQLIGHYTMQCEDPLHSSLWANISNNSVLDLTVTPIALANDLALLPTPFFDRRDINPLNLPVVFASQPDNTTLEAAGTLSSWFGSLAKYRGARFPASIATLPQSGNAIVFLAGQTGVPGVDAPPVNAPTLTVVTNPNDPNGKLLLVRGRDSAELKLAAAALATGSQTLSGASATITQYASRDPRKPYDAPNWLPSDRPVKFGELMDAKDMNVSGYSPDIIRVRMRVAPDLFTWREKGIPVDLKYRYTPQPDSLNSALLVNVNDQFLKSLPLLSLKNMGGGDNLAAAVRPDETLPMQTKLMVAPHMLAGETQLQFRYMYDYIKQGECRDIIIDNVRGAIEPESTIDVSSYSHFMAMPNLNVFQNSGFPFTRLADLSQTAVVLPDNAAAADYSAYLGVLGRMGESTGYPATGVTVTQAQRVESVADKDLLVIGSGGNQPLAKQWADLMPASIDGNAKRFGLSDYVYRAVDWFSPDPRATDETARNRVSFTTEGASAMFAGFESPLAKGRSVVMLSASQPAGLAEAVDALIGGEGYENTISGSLAVVRGKDVQSVLSDQKYYVGKLGVFKRVQWFMSEYLTAFVLASAIGAILAVLALYLSLRRRAARRVQGN